MYSKGWSDKRYKNRDNLDRDSGTYNNSDWVDKQVKRILNFEKEKKLSVERNNIIIQEVENNKNNIVRIIDYGGGLGLSYMPIRSSTEKHLDYNIVEVSKVVDKGREIYNDNSEVRFFNNIDEIVKSPDIFYIRTSLQYAKDWKGILEKACKLGSKKIIIVDTAAGDIETFLTYQLWGDEKIPYWFINKKELIKKIEKHGYICTHDKISQSIEDNVSFIDLKKYPESFRIKELVNLMFDKV